MICRWIFPVLGSAVLCVPALGQQKESALHNIETVRAINSELAQFRQGGLEQIRRLVLQRAVALSELWETDAGQAPSLALPEDVLAQLRAQLPEDLDKIESRGEWNGAVEVVVEDDFERSTSRTNVTLITGGERLQVYFAGEAPPVKCGDIVRARGMRLGRFVGAMTTSITSVAASSSCSPIGAQNVAVLLVNFGTVTLPPQITPSYLSGVFFGSGNRSLDGYWREASYNKASASGSVFGPFTLSQSLTCDQAGTVLNAAIPAADSSLDFRNYNRIFIIMPASGSCSNLGSIGCYSSLTSPSKGSFQASVAWLRSDTVTPNDLGVAVAAHEGGHNLGLNHASSLGFGTLPLGSLGATGTHNEYGDSYSAMGYGQNAFLGHYAAPHKSSLGWLAGANVQDVQAPGTFLLQPYETNTSGLQAIRVHRGLGSNNAWLWLEYRQPIGYDATFQVYSTQAYSGALIHYENPPSFPGYTQLLAFNLAAPGDFLHPALASGSTWSDPYTELGLVMNNATPSYLSVTVNYGTPCAVLSAPSATVGPGSGSGSVGVTASGTCSWMAVSNANWITISGGASGTGSGTVSYTFAANNTPNLRTGSISIGGQLYSVTQDSMYAPSAPVLTSPLFASTGLSLTTSLNWSASSGATSYDIYLGTSSPPSSVVGNTGLTSYSPTLSANTTYYWQIVAKNSAGTASSAIWWFMTGAPVGLGFFPLTPCRITDTRIGQGKTGAFGPPILTAYSSRDFPILSSGCGIPASAQAYSLNMTAAPQGHLDFLSTWPAGQSYPGVSTLNSPNGGLIANAAIVPAGTNGAITVVAGNPTDLIIDVNGSFAAPNGQELVFYPVTPCRVADTRVGQGKTGAFGPPSLAGYSSRDFPILSSTCGIPASARAYSLNMTAAPQGHLDFLSTWPAGQSYPGVSTLNSPNGGLIANAAIVPAGTNGAITVVAGNPTDLIIDINGYFAPPGSSGALHFYPVTPCRVADTRIGQGKTGAFGPPSLAGYSSRDFPILSGGCGIPASAQAYSLNMTAAPQGPLDFLSTWPAGQSYPGVSTLNSPSGALIANAAIVPAGANGAITVGAGNPTDLIIDINGYFAP